MKKQQKPLEEWRIMRDLHTALYIRDAIREADDVRIAKEKDGYDVCIRFDARHGGTSYTSGDFLANSLLYDIEKLREEDKEKRKPLFVPNPKRRIKFTAEEIDEIEKLFSLASDHTVFTFEDCIEAPAIFHAIGFPYKEDDNQKNSHSFTRRLYEIFSNAWVRSAETNRQDDT